jgi:DNA-binding MarR family transcriptional regulator
MAMCPIIRPSPRTGTVASAIAIYCASCSRRWCDAAWRRDWSAARGLNTTLLAGTNRTCFCPRMAEPTSEQVEQLTRAFERFTRRFKVAEAAAAAENALNALDAQTLTYIDVNPGCGMGDVARYLNVAMTTMSSAIDRLVKKMLVERRRPEDNRRAVALSATEQGHQVVEETIAGYRHACRMMLISLDPSEQSELIRLTEKIADHET